MGKRKITATKFFDDEDDGKRKISPPKRYDEDEAHQLQPPAKRGRKPASSRESRGAPVPAAPMPGDQLKARGGLQDDCQMTPATAGARQAGLRLSNACRSTSRSSKPCRTRHVQAWPCCSWLQAARLRPAAVDSDAWAVAQTWTPATPRADHEV